MSNTLAIIDYGSGNLRSAEKALQRVSREGATEHEILVTSDPERVAAAERIVLPGVGAFGDCMGGLSAIPGMVEALHERVLKKGAPFLGICVGMQVLFENYQLGTPTHFAQHLLARDSMIAMQCDPFLMRA